MRHDGHHSYVSISDTGIGIPAKRLNSIFELDQDKKRKGTDGERGTGLGLKLVHEFVKLNKATIGVKSKVGDGTTFTLSFVYPYVGKRISEEQPALAYVG